MKEAVIKKSLEKAIEMKWITKNELLTMDGLVGYFVGEINEAERKDKLEEKRNTMIDLMLEFFPKEKVTQFLRD